MIENPALERFLNGPRIGFGSLTEYAVLHLYANELTPVFVTTSREAALHDLGTHPCSDYCEGAILAHREVETRAWVWNDDVSSESEQ